jgi:putative copper resistance protein D
MGAMPVFEPDGGPALVLARGFAVAFLLSAAGTATFRTVVLPRALARMTPDVAARIARALARCLRLSAIGGGAGLLAWLAAVTADLAAPHGIGGWAGGLWTVLSDTRFGHVLLLQAALLAAAAASLGRRPGVRRWWVCGVFATAATVAQTGHGHAVAMAQGLTVLEVSEALHLWAAGAWLGGLAPLLLVVLLAPPAAAVAAARWFSPLGQVCLVVMAVTALLQGWVLVGSFAALRDTAYGWTALLKVSLYGVLLGFAVLNRYRLCPALRGPRAEAARGALIASLVLQTGFGLLVVLAAGLLGQLQPGMDMGMGMAG